MTESQKCYNGNREYDLYERLVKKDWVCIDVGAHIGKVTKVVAPRANTTHSFEPTKQNFAGLLKTQKSLNLGDALNVYNFGMSDTVGQAEIHTSGNRSAIWSLAKQPVWNEQPRTRGHISSQKINLTTLDEFCRGMEKLDFVKIDVEGAEPLVIRGGMDAIEKHRPFLPIEMFRPWRHGFDYDEWEIFDNLLSLDYKFMFFADDNKFNFFEPTKERPFPDDFIWEHMMFAFQEDMRDELISVTNEMKGNKYDKVPIPYENK